MVIWKEIKTRISLIAQIRFGETRAHFFSGQLAFKWIADNINKFLFAST